MSEDNIAIKVEGVNKTFKLPHEKASSVKHLFINFFRPRGGYEKQQVLKDISFEIKKGEFFGIVGRNGSGKSTLLKLLAGIYSPDSGHIQTTGKLVPFIELGVGFNPELTGRENVYLNGALLGFSEEEVDGFYDEVVDFAELERFMDQKLKNYSSGMQVRLAFSMAVQAKADILLIDEVLAVGDADFQRKCFEYFKTLKKNQKTVVFVSHDMDAIREYCTQAVLLESSKIILSATSEKVAQAYTKLFNVGAINSDSVAKGTNRWGDNFAKTESIKTSVENNTIKIRQIIKANEPIEECIAGLRIRDSSGAHITGTNSKLEKQKILNLAKNQRIELTWELPNIFSSGKYLLDPAIVHSDGITVHDWWDEANSFTINKGRNSPYAIDPGFKLNLHKL